MTERADASDALTNVDEGLPRIPPSHTDAELIRRLLAGEEAAFLGLVSQHNGTLLRVARGFLASGSVAEEVVQETWMAVLKGLPKFQGRSALKTWIFRILANRARTRARKEGRSIPMSALGKLDQNGKPVVDVDRFTTTGMWARPPTEFGGTPDSMADRSEIREQVESAIATLPDRQRLVITLRDLDGCSSDEVCNVLEISATNQRVLLHRARSKVRQALENFMRGQA